MSALRWAVAIAVAVLGTVGLGALSQVPYDHEPASHAVIRLAWRTRGATVEECRRPSAEELAKLPAHMRQEEVCEGRVLPYRLTVSVDGRPTIDRTVRARGARADRPLYVFDEIPVAPGEHRLAIGFAPLPSRSGDAIGDRAPTPDRLDWEGAIRLSPKEIALITYDDERRMLVVRRSSVDSNSP